MYLTPASWAVPKLPASQSSLRLDPPPLLQSRTKFLKGVTQGCTQK